MLNPRNTLVAVAEVRNEERKTAAGIVVPAKTQTQYRLAEIVKVGPGMATQKDEVSLTRDLHPGQMVLVKVATRHRVDERMVGLEPIGIEYTTEDGRAITLVDQTHVVAIVETPVTEH